MPVTLRKATDAPDQTHLRYVVVIDPDDHPDPHRVRIKVRTALTPTFTWHTTSGDVEDTSHTQARKAVREMFDVDGYVLSVTPLLSRGYTRIMHVDAVLP